MHHPQVPGEAVAAGVRAAKIRRHLPLVAYAPPWASSWRERTVIVAVSRVNVVKVVKVATDQIVGVVTVGHSGVSTVGTVYMPRIMRAARVLRCANGWVCSVDRKAALVDVVIVHVVKMPIMKVVDVTLMADGGMTAGGSVNVVVAIVGAVSGHSVLRSKIVPSLQRMMN